MLRAVVGPVVEAFFGSELDPIDELDVGTFVDFGSVAGGEIGNEKTDRPAGVGREWLAVEPVDHQRPVDNGGERNAGVKIVGGRVYP